MAKGKKKSDKPKETKKPVKSKEQKKPSKTKEKKKLVKPTKEKKKPEKPTKGKKKPEKPTKEKKKPEKDDPNKLRSGPHPPPYCKEPGRPQNPVRRKIPKYDKKCTVERWKTLSIPEKEHFLRNYRKFERGVGWNPLEAAVFYLILKQHGCGQWSTFEYYLPHQNTAKYNTFAQKLYGQQSLAPFSGMKVDPYLVFKEKTDLIALRKNGVRVHEGIPLSTAEKKEKKAFWRERQHDNYYQVPVVEDRSRNYTKIWYQMEKTFHKVTKKAKERGKFDKIMAARNLGPDHHKKVNHRKWLDPAEQWPKPTVWNIEREFLCLEGQDNMWPLIRMVEDDDWYAIDQSLHWNWVGGDLFKDPIYREQFKGINTREARWEEKDLSLAGIDPRKIKGCGIKKVKKQAKKEEAKGDGAAEKSGEKAKAEAAEVKKKVESKKATGKEKGKKIVKSKKKSESGKKAEKAGSKKADGKSKVKASGNKADGKSKVKVSGKKADGKTKVKASGKKAEGKTKVKASGKKAEGKPKLKKVGSKKKVKKTSGKKVVKSSGKKKVSVKGKPKSKKAVPKKKVKKIEPKWKGTLWDSNSQSWTTYFDPLSNHTLKLDSKRKKFFKNERDAAREVNRLCVLAGTELLNPDVDKETDVKTSKKIPVSKWTCEQLVKYLREQKLSAELLKKIEEANISGQDAFNLDMKQAEELFKDKKEEGQYDTTLMSAVRKYRFS